MRCGMSVVNDVQDLLAVQEINLLITRYARHCDNPDLDQFMTLWHPQASWSIAYLGTPGTPTQTVTGTEAIRARAAEALTRYVFTQHVFANTTVQFLENRTSARVGSNLVAVLEDKDGRIYLATGINDDICVHEDGRWWLMNRRFSMSRRIVVA